MRWRCLGGRLPRTATPLQFAVAPYWEGGKRVGVVQVAITLRTDTENILVRFGFAKATVLAKHGSYGSTVDAIPKDEQEFLSMEPQPMRRYAYSFWGAGLGDSD